MILSDREIKAALDRGALKITPRPNLESWSSTAVDLHLADELSQWKDPGGSGVESSICPANPDYNFTDVAKRYSETIKIGKGYIFEPNSFLLAWTIEKVQLPYLSRFAARVEGKSSLARLGIGVHVTAPTIHAGFGAKAGDDKYPGSPLQLEMWNCGPLRVKLVAGMAICQLIFEIVDGTPEKGYIGQFSVQGPQTSASSRSSKRK